MNIFRRELKCNRKSLLIWVLALAVLNFWMITMIPSITADGQAMEEMLEMYPESMVKMFNLDKLNMADPIGFYGIEIYFIIVLFGGIYAAILGSGILAKEEDDKTIEFLLAKPVTRGGIIIEKLLAWITNLVLFNLILSAVSWVGFEIFVDDYSRSTFLLLLVAPLLIHLVFGAMGFATALLFTRRKAALSASIGLVLGFYFLNIAAQLSEGQFLGWFTPFRYVDAADIVGNGKIEPLYILVLLGVTVLLSGFTWWRYQHRDITI